MNKQSLVFPEPRNQYTMPTQTSHFASTHDTKQTYQGNTQKINTKHFDAGPGCNKGSSFGDGIHTVRVQENLIQIILEVGIIRNKISFLKK